MNATWAADRKFVHIVCPARTLFKNVSRLSKTTICFQKISLHLHNTPTC